MYDTPYDKVNYPMLRERSPTIYFSKMQAPPNLLLLDPCYSDSLGLKKIRYFMTGKLSIHSVRYKIVFLV